MSAAARPVGSDSVAPGCGIEVCGLAKTFDSAGSALSVLRDLSFTVASGETVALVGPSGSGKSTLLHLLGGLDRPTAGEILFDGVPLSSLAPSALADFRNRTLGFVWQSHHLLADFTALENVMMPLLLRKMPPTAAAAAARMALAEVELESRTTHRPGELSGGEQQRVALARALAGSPRLLLADEPTGNLDDRTAGSVIDLLLSLRDRKRLTIVLVTHHLGFAARCDRVLAITAGSLSPISRPALLDYSWSTGEDKLYV